METETFGENQIEFVSNQEPFVPEEFLEMYKVPGQEDITAHSFARYLNDKKNDQEIKDQVESSVSFYIWKIESASDYRKTDLIRMGLSSDNAKLQKACAQLIVLAPENKRATLIREGISKTNIELQDICINMIPNVPQDERASLIREGLLKDDVKVQKTCAEVIYSVPYGKEKDNLRKTLANLIKTGLTREDPKVQLAYAEMIWFARADQKAELIMEGLSKNSTEVQIACAKTIHTTPSNEIPDLKKNYQV